MSHKALFIILYFTESTDYLTEGLQKSVQYATVLLCSYFLITLSKKIRMHSESELFHFTLTIARAKRTKLSFPVTVQCLFTYITSSLQNQLRSSFLSSRWFSFQLTFNVIRRSSWDPHPLNNFIDPTFFSAFDKISILHIRKGQFRIWEALYENNLLTPLSFWSFVGFIIYSVHQNLILLKIFQHKFWNEPYELFESYS